MVELVGNCLRCGKEIYCLNGFLNGIILENGKLLCFDCDENEEEA